MGAPIIWFGTRAKLLPPSLVIPGSTSGTLELRPAAATVSYGIVFPALQGANQTTLVNDSTGALSWGTVSSILSLGAFGSSPNASGATLSASTLTLQPADGTNPGGVSITTQTFAGDKTLLGTTTTAGLNVTSLVLTVNSGGAAASGAVSGLQINENNVITGYARTSADRNSWLLKAPNTAGIVTITPGVSGFIIDQASHSPVTLTAVGASPNANGASLSGQALTLQPADGTNPGLVTAIAQTIAGQKTFSTGVTATVTGTASGNTTITPNNHAVVLSSATNTLSTAVPSATSGVALVSNGTSSDPSFGTVAIAGGGTGQTTASTAFNALSPVTSTGDLIIGNGVNSATRLAIGGSSTVLTSNGTTASWQPASGSSLVAPTIQKFTSGSGTYTKPSSPAPLYIRIVMVGGGGGGGGSAAGAPTAGGAGGNSTFGTTLLVANGGAGGGLGGPGGTNNAGAGGSASLGTGPVGIAISGSGGQGGSNALITVQGGSGGTSALGGAGSGAIGVVAGGSAATNSGSGGGGSGGSIGSYASASGGGSGGYVDAIITSPSSTYAYAVGAAGAQGTGTNPGGFGGDGLITVYEYYQ